MNILGELLGLREGALNWRDDLLQSATRRETPAQSRARAAARFFLAGTNPTDEEVARHAGQAPMRTGTASQRDLDLANAAVENYPEAASEAQQMGLMADLQAAGISPAEQAAAWKLQRLQQFLAEPGLTREQVGQILSGEDLSPYRVSGATGYNRYTGAMRETPVGQAEVAWRGTQQQRLGAQMEADRALAAQRQAAAQTEAEQQRLYQASTRERAAQAADAEVRLRATRDFIESPDASPMARMDAANRKPLFKPARRTALVNGQTVYVDALPQPDGSVKYSRALGPDQQPLQVPPNERDGKRQTFQFEALAREAMAQFDIAPDEAFQFAQAPAAEQSQMIRKWRSEGRVKPSSQAIQRWGSKQKQLFSGAEETRPAAPAAPAASPAAPSAPAGGSATVTLPNGKVKVFPSAEAAAAFRARYGL